ncbi:MAG: 4-amino-4-deoxy-L-arabinose transferase-like glycosyltransferase, partial [Verrucomicrobiales bacterium]
MSRRRHLLILLVLSAIVLFTGLGNRTLQRERETRIALTAREMADGGSWLVPEYRGELRLKKPPVPYWMVAVLYKAGVPVNSAFWARLPTALMALGLVFATYFAGAAMVGRQAAYLGALALITTQPFLVQGRVAEADAEMMFFLVMSVGCAYVAMHRRGHGWWWLAAGGCAGMAFMMKGIAGVVIPIGSIAMFVALRPDALRGGRWRWALGGLLACLLIAAPWYFYIYNVTHGDGAASEAIAKQMEETFSSSAGRHPEPFWYYLENWPGTMAPWGLLAPFAGWALWKRRRHRGVAFLFAWFVVGLVLLSLITTKQRHYALILLPPTALAAGWWMTLMLARRGIPKVRGVEIVCTLLALAASAYLGFFQPKKDDVGVIPGFMERAEALAAESGEVWTTGKMPWCTEFYFQRKVQSMGSVPKAWRRVPLGGAMVAIQQGKPLKGIKDVDGELVLDEQRGDIRCQLYL